MTLPAFKMKEKVRAFTLTTQPEGPEAFGLHFQEVTGDGSGLLVRMNASRTRRVMESVLAAAKKSGHAKSALGHHRTRTLMLTEEAGVRLALVLLTSAPLVKSRRVDAMAQAIAAMATEESYYWYAKCVGPEGRRARRALRLLLAEE